MSEIPRLRGARSRRLRQPHPQGRDARDRGGLRGAEENRNTEYHAFDDAYATFLLEEIIPAVRARYVITDDPNRWAIAGGSSGGNCACSSGSFVQMPGGNPYPELIRTMPPKPLRIWLHAATRDLNWDKPVDNWLSANLQVAAALAERGYDFRLVVGDGGHDGNHGGVLPDALRWLWRPQPA